MQYMSPSRRPRLDTPGRYLSSISGEKHVQHQQEYHHLPHLLRPPRRSLRLRARARGRPQLGAGPPREPQPRRGFRGRWSVDPLRRARGTRHRRGGERGGRRPSDQRDRGGRARLREQGHQLANCLGGEPLEGVARLPLLLERCAGRCQSLRGGLSGLTLRRHLGLRVASSAALRGEFLLDVSSRGGGGRTLDFRCLSGGVELLAPAQRGRESITAHARRTASRRTRSARRSGRRG
jgi:hypothetical protein